MDSNQIYFFLHINICFINKKRGRGREIEKTSSISYFSCSNQILTFYPVKSTVTQCIVLCWLHTQYSTWYKYVLYLFIYGFLFNVTYILIRSYPTQKNVNKIKGPSCNKSWRIYVKLIFLVVLDEEYYLFVYNSEIKSVRKKYFE